LVLGTSVLCGAEMAKMHRIKTSAEETDVHGIEVGDGDACRKPNGDVAVPDKRSTVGSENFIAERIR
jgi:hypothetical protein